MDKFDRIVQLHAILSARRAAISIEQLMERLECSRSTLYRTVEALRDRLGAPIGSDSAGGGLRYERDIGSGPYELPGLWFNAAELQALVTMQRLLSSLSPGFLEQQLAPLSRRLEVLTHHRRLNLGEAAQRIRVPAIAARPPGAAFEPSAVATLQRRKLAFEYHSRGKDERSRRTVSPQRLTHYRDAWYLDAWDELRGALRSFAVDRMRAARVLEERASDIAEAVLDEHFASSYGIFGGKANRIAVLRFSAERSRWVADERWHPQQQGQFLTDGRYELRIPYRDPRELVMDILRHVPEVEVIEPRGLREELIGLLRAALDLHESGASSQKPAGGL